MLKNPPMPPKTIETTAASNRPKRGVKAENPPHEPAAKKQKTPTQKKQKIDASDKRSTNESSVSANKSPKATSKSKTHAQKPANLHDNPAQTKSKPKKDHNTTPPITTTTTAADSTAPPAQNYWLMKAEPNTRIEKGVDVKFSIDDLRAVTQPEPWEGVRNHAAKKNMMAMREGELAFFYHSNCKVPGIAGIMEIVGGSSADGMFNSSGIHSSTCCCTTSFLEKAGLMFTYLFRPI